MSSLLDDLRGAFRAQGDALRRLIIYNVVVFVGLVVLGAVLKLSGLEWLYNALRSWLVLPSWPTPSGFLTRPWTVLSYAFVHEGFFHILFNMLNLYWFGQLIQEYLGSRRLVSLYILGVLAGAITFLVAVNFIPALATTLGATTLEGASGAVLAVIVGAATLLPDYTFMLLLFGQVKIKWIAAVLVLLSVAGLAGVNGGGQFAHLGGALLGYVYIRQLKAGNDLGKPIQAIGEWFQDLFAPRPPMHVSHRGGAGAAPAASVPGGSPGQADIDRILDKISRSGYNSLTTEEKQQLFRASQK